MYTIRISGKDKAIPIPAESKADLMEKVGALVGSRGIAKLTITWELDHFCKCETIDPVIRDKTPKPKVDGRFYEIDDALKPGYNILHNYRDLPMRNMGYYDLGEIIVICYNETRVYTTFAAIESLPDPVPKDKILHLGNNKQTAIRQFRKWIAAGKPQVPPKEPKVLRDPQLNVVTMPAYADTRCKDSGDFKNETGSYEP